MNLALARVVDLHVAKVADHPLFVVGGAVVLAKGVEDARAGREVHGEVAKHVDVEAVLSRGQARDLSLDDSRSVLGGLRQAKESLNSVS